MEQAGESPRTVSLGQSVRGAQCVGEAIEEFRLRGNHFRASDFEGEKFGAIDFWKLPLLARARRPFEGECVGLHARDVAIAFDGPSVHDFAGFLANFAQRYETGRAGNYAGDFRTQLFGEFAAG